MAQLTADDERRLTGAIKVANDLVETDKLSPDAAIEKVARERQLGPGWVRTPPVEKQIEDKAKQKGISVEEAAGEILGEKQPNKRFIHPEQIGALIAFLCGENGTAMTGEILTVDGGWTAQ